MGGIIWIIIVGFVAGIIARFLSPGPNNPSGFILTTALLLFLVVLVTGIIFAAVLTVLLATAGLGIAF